MAKTKARKAPPSDTDALPLTEESVLAVLKTSYRGLTTDEVAAFWPYKNRNTVDKLLSQLYRAKKLKAEWHDVFTGFSVRKYKFRQPYH